MKLNLNLFLLSLILGLSLSACTAPGASKPNPNPPAPKPDNQLPIAKFSTRSEQLSVFFDASASQDKDGVIRSYAWDYGNGKTGTGKTGSFNYKQAGNYDITLTVTDNNAGQSSSVQTLTVADNANQAPKAAFSVEAAFLSVKVDAELASDSDGEIRSYAWDLGEGLTSTDRFTFRTYEAAGDYPISLTVVDDKGALNTITQMVRVGAKGNVSGSLSIEGPIMVGDPLEGGGMLISSFITDLRGDRVRSGSQFASEVFSDFDFDVDVGAQSLVAWIDLNVNDCKGVSKGDYFGRYETMPTVTEDKPAKDITFSLKRVETDCQDNQALYPELKLK